MSRANATYLGDGVYVKVENGMICLTTENGLATTNTIYLEPDVLDGFIRYASASGLPTKTNPCTFCNGTGEA